MTIDPLTTSTSSHLTAQERSAVLLIDAAATAVDGVSPLDDQVRLDLEYGDPATSRHILVRPLNDPRIVGYAHLGLTDTDRADGHLVVHPDHRRHSVGTTLVDVMQSVAGPRRLRIWAHGDDAAARFLAGRLDFHRVRELWRMVKSLADELGSPVYPDGVTVRTFVCGQDEAAWVAVNAAAFAAHPEQGRMTMEDLEQRKAQDWFDPAGFFLAERAGRVVGFHWTKVHKAGDLHPEPIGEVYAVGVDPTEQGRGLGKALTLTGLHYLRDCGLAAVMLYVDADNGPAVAVYERLGFQRAAVDVMYER